MPGPQGRQPLPERFRAQLLAERPLPPGSTAVVGVSGRADSVALLHLLRGLAGERDLQLIVAHVQHGAGDLPVADAAFVRDLAERLHLPLFLYEDDRPATDADGRAGERARYFTHVRALTGASAIATGETADDLAERLLTTLVTDAPFPAPHLPFPLPDHLRPLLPFTHAECAAFLAAQNIAFRQNPDALGLSPDAQKLRLLVLPMLRRHVQNRALPNLARSAQWLADDHLFIEELARAARAEVGWTAADGRVSFSHGRWTALPASLRRRLLSGAAETVAPAAPFARASLDTLDADCRTLLLGTSATSGALKVTFEDGMLSFVKAHHHSGERSAPHPV